MDVLYLGAACLTVVPLSSGLPFKGPHSVQMESHRAGNHMSLPGALGEAAPTPKVGCSSRLGAWGWESSPRSPLMNTEALSHPQGMDHCVPGLMQALTHVSSLPTTATARFHLRDSSLFSVNLLLLSH
jgi:hypothetical protein